MEKLQFSTGDILGRSWSIFKQRWTQIFGVGVLYMVLSSIASGLPALFQNADSQVATVVSSLVAQVLSLFLSIGITKIVLAIVRQQEVNIADMFSGGKYLLQYFLGSLVVGIITMVGFLLLIVPGIIWSLKYMFVLYLIIDENMDFSKAMKESEVMTKGIKWQLLVFGLALMGVNMLGMIPLFLGLFITIPVTSLASFVLYDVLRKQALAVTDGSVSAQPTVSMAQPAVDQAQSVAAEPNPTEVPPVQQGS